MQDTFEIGHPSKKDRSKIMQAIWEDLSNHSEEIESPECIVY